MMEVGNRVGLIKSLNRVDRVVEVIGYGTFEGFSVPDVREGYRPLHSDFNIALMGQLGVDVPKVTLDGGRKVYVDGVLWASEASVKTLLDTMRGQGWSVTRTYPLSAQEIIDDTMTYPEGALVVMNAYKGSHPWAGKPAEIHAKAEALLKVLTRTYFDSLWENMKRNGVVSVNVTGEPMMMAKPNLVFSGKDGMRGHYYPVTHTISITGKYSVITLLHEFAHSMGLDEWDATRWSVNLYKRTWPQLYSKLYEKGHMLIRSPDAKAHSRPVHVPPSGIVEDDSEDE